MREIAFYPLTLAFCASLILHGLLLIASDLFNSVFETSYTRQRATVVPINASIIPAQVIKQVNESELTQALPKTSKAKQSALQPLKKESNNNKATHKTEVYSSGALAELASLNNTNRIPPHMTINSAPIGSQQLIGLQSQTAAIVYEVTTKVGGILASGQGLLTWDSELSNYSISLQAQAGAHFIFSDVKGHISQQVLLPTTLRQQWLGESMTSAAFDWLNSSVLFLQSKKSNTIPLQTQDKLSAIFQILTVIKEEGADLSKVSQLNASIINTNTEKIIAHKVAAQFLERGMNPSIKIDIFNDDEQEPNSEIVLNTSVGYFPSSLTWRFKGTRQDDYIRLELPQNATTQKIPE